jgi:signal transduction histidine kinase
MVAKSEMFKRASHPQDPISASYAQWQRHFMLERLQQAVKISLIAYPCIIVGVVLIGQPLLFISTKSGINWYLFFSWLVHFLTEASIAEFCLLLCLLLLKLPKTKRYLNLLFLGFSWSLTLMTQIRLILDNLPPMNPFTLLIGFPSVAMLVPVCWQLHLVSEGVVLTWNAVAIAQMFLTANPRNFWSKLPPEQTAAFLTGFGAYVLVVCLVAFVSTMGVFLYERSLRTEFEYRERLRIFLHTVSHDLRNPVAGTGFLLSSLCQQPDPIILDRQILLELVGSSERQLQLIDSLIETHTAQMHGILLNYQAIALHELLQTVLADLKSLIQDKQATIINRISPDLPQLQVDPLQISRVYQNLIVNAIIHNRPKTIITLDAHLEGTWIHCTVADDGVGIKPEQAKTLFNPYTRGTKSKRNTGLGLGLYICQQVVLSHGGEIGITSGLETGSTFWFTLPMGV